jgi:hypothetical protein
MEAQSFDVLKVQAQEKCIEMIALVVFGGLKYKS